LPLCFSCSINRLLEDCWKVPNFGTS
jgi:hypothetical protein